MWLPVTYNPNSSLGNTILDTHHFIILPLRTPRITLNLLIIPHIRNFSQKSGIHVSVCGIIYHNCHWWNEIEDCYPHPTRKRCLHADLGPSSKSISLQSLKQTNNLTQNIVSYLQVSIKFMLQVCLFCSLHKPLEDRRQ